jgi:hypothetical protein
VTSWHRHLTAFEADIDAAHALLEPAYSVEPAQSCLDTLAGDNVQAIIDFVQQLLGSLRDLAHGLAHLEGHALSALTQTDDEGNAPIAVLLRLVRDGLGVEALRDFVVELCSSVVRKITREVNKAGEKV